MARKKEEENVHNFPVYPFDKKSIYLPLGPERYLVYRKNFRRAKYEDGMEFMLPDGTLTKDIHIDYWFNPRAVERNLSEGADYLGVGVLHKWSTEA